MPNVCIVAGCGKSSRKNKLSFFSIPKDNALREQWLNVLKIPPPPPGTRATNMRVCSAHFTPDDYFRFATLLKLKKGKVPHVFIKSEHSGIPTTDKIVQNDVLKIAHSHTRKQRPVKCHTVRTSELAFSVEKIMNNNMKIMYFTGIPSYAIFQILFTFLLKPEEGEKEALSARARSHPKHEITLMNELFITLMHLKRGVHHKLLAYKFHISRLQVNVIVTTWTSLLFSKLIYRKICPSISIRQQWPLYFYHRETTRTKRYKHCDRNFNNIEPFDLAPLSKFKQYYMRDIKA